MNKPSTTRAGLAGAAALLALAALGMSNPSFAAEKEQPTRCYGINSCKGESLCATAKNDCKGLNECKGQGVLVKTPSECKALGGTLTEKE
ncbi:BufA2 family periplasmic bufferin-type metallophore [Massilia sp. DD77]|uniref:BufA2 family periplasmic bufferin-type metallophore n=1 Tax=Massilia sp. DD77 TaxID=3109349 RepID=UPI0030005259